MTDMDWKTRFDIDISSVEASIRTLHKQKSALQKKRDKVLAQRFIEAHSMTIDDVQLLEDAQEQARTHFNNIWQYADWLKESSKKFAEWCRGIYFTKKLLEGNTVSTPVSLADLQPSEDT